MHTLGWNGVSSRRAVGGGGSRTDAAVDECRNEMADFVASHQFYRLVPAYDIRERLGNGTLNTCAKIEDLSLKTGVDF